jgi:hypothetical protein
MYLHQTPCVIIPLYLWSILHHTSSVQVASHYPSQLSPLAQNGHSNEPYRHGTESCEHFVWLGVSQRSIHEVGG